MRYEDLFVGILIIVLLAIAAARILAPKREDGRGLLRDQAGALIAMGDQRQTEGTLSGRGAQTSASLQLAAGLYRIAYDFKTLTRLALIDPLDGSDETLIITSGTGETSVEIAQAGRYHLRVEPNGRAAAWSVHYRPMF